MAVITHPRPTLDVRDLELVLAVAAAGSTVKAAAKLHLTQSAVSRALLAVEDKLGVRLFERRARGLSPTPAAARLVADAGALLAQMVELEQRVRSPIRPARVRVVCECYTAYKWLPSAVARLRASGASLDVVLALDHTSAPVDALLAGDVDVAFLTTARAPKSLVERPLFSDEIVFLVAATHPLAARASIERSDLERHPLITSQQTPERESRWFFRRVFGRTTPRLERIRLPLTEAIVDATRAGMGIAAISEWIAIPYLAAGDLVVKRLRRGPLERPWRMAFPRSSKDVALRLAAALDGAAPKLVERAPARLTT